jgi:hypothetical protein
MIIASLLLVIAAAVTLLMGLLNREVIEWVYASIACCILAGILLTIGVLRSRPSRKPVLSGGGEGQAASWAGASQWGGDTGGQGGAGVLTRDAEDEPDDATVRVAPEPADADELTGDDEPTRTSLPEAESDASPWAPADEQADTGDIPEVRVLPPAEPAAGPDSDVAPAVQETPAAHDDDDVVVVPKPSARGDQAPPPAPAAAAAGGTAADEAERFEQVLSPIAGVGPAKRKALLAHFGTYRKLRAATPEKLAEVQGVSRTLADRIHKALHS